MRTVVLLSGGMDSVTLLYQQRAVENVVFPISFNYGQRHNRELGNAEYICEKLGLTHRIINLTGVTELLTGSSQTDPNVEVPEGHYADESMKKTVIPNRNMIMLSVAGAYAIQVGAKAIAYAAHTGDHAIYPDCRPPFVQAMWQAFQTCHFDPIELIAPFQHITKAEIAALGHRLSVPYEWTWSCYKGGRLHCGKCGTCVERREAFKLANLEDPTEYEVDERTDRAPQSETAPQSRSEGSGGKSE